MSDKPVIVELQVAVMRRAKGWCIVGADNHTIAGISEKAFDAIATGEALGKEQILEHYSDWALWARRMNKKCRKAKPPDAWGRRFQGMTQSSKRRKPRTGNGRGRPRKKSTDWESRLGELAKDADSKWNRRAVRQDPWTRWSESAARNCNRREADRASDASKAQAASRVAEPDMRSDRPATDTGRN